MKSTDYFQTGFKADFDVFETRRNCSIISQAAAVMRDVPEDVIAMGNPARVIRKNEEHRVFK